MYLAIKWKIYNEACNKYCAYFTFFIAFMWLNVCAFALCRGVRQLVALSITGNDNDKNKTNNNSNSISTKPCAVHRYHPFNSNLNLYAFLYYSLDKHENRMPTQIFKAASAMAHRIMFVINRIGSAQIRHVIKYANEIYGKKAKKTKQFACVYLGNQTHLLFVDRIQRIVFLGNKHDVFIRISKKNCCKFPLF